MLDMQINDFAYIWAKSNFHDCICIWKIKKKEDKCKISSLSLRIQISAHICIYFVCVCIFLLIPLILEIPLHPLIPLMPLIISTNAYDMLCCAMLCYVIFLWFPYKRTHIHMYIWYIRTDMYVCVSMYAAAWNVPL